MMRSTSRRPTWILLASLALMGCPNSSSGDGADAGSDVPAATDAADADTRTDTGALDAPSQDVVTSGDVVSARDVVTTTDGSTMDAATTDAPRADASTTDAASADVVDASPVDDIADDAPQDVAEPMCPEGQRVCTCATGYYCLRIGAACLVPTAPCPAL